MPLECDINIAVNGLFWVEVANPEHPLTAMLTSRSRGTCLIEMGICLSPVSCHTFFWSAAARKCIPFVLPLSTTSCLRKIQHLARNMLNDYLHLYKIELSSLVSHACFKSWDHTRHSYNWGKQCNKLIILSCLCRISLVTLH